jgi:cytochrome P450
VTTRTYEIHGPAFQADPYRVFARMRDEDPVVRQPGIDGETMIWFVSRYDDVAAVLLDDERFVRDPRRALTPEQLAARPPQLTNELIESHMLNRDGADHRRLRRLVTKAFTPRMVEGLRPRVQEIADELLDRVEARGEMDLVAQPPWRRCSAGCPGSGSRSRRRSSPTAPPPRSARSSRCPWRGIRPPRSPRARGTGPTAAP